MDRPSITRRLFLFLTGGLLARLGFRAASADDRTALSAREILDRMAAAYAGCSTYQDTGCVTTDLILAAGRRTRQQPFSTAFVRPDRFRFEFEDAGSRRPHRYIVWADGADVRTWWDVRPGVGAEPSIGLALAGATGVSGGSAHTVPALLMPDQVGGRLLTDLTALRRLDDARLGENDCFRVQGTVASVPTASESTQEEFRRVTGREMSRAVHRPKTLWIDRTTFLLRRIDETTEFTTFRAENTTTYEPQIDAAVSDERLRFNPPDLPK